VQEPESLRTLAEVAELDQDQAEFVKHTAFSIQRLRKLNL
jgi:hypothetical protein